MPLLNDTITDVRFQCEPYAANLEDWLRVRDCVAGQRRIKEAEEDYLPKPNKKDTSLENKQRYEDYLDRALFYEVTGVTLESLVGEVFSKDPLIELPAELEILQEDSGDTIPIEQQTKRVLEDVLALGRAGLLVDFSNETEGVDTSRQALLTGETQVIVSRYDAEDIINWRVEKIEGKKQLTLVVLHECVDSAGIDNAFRTAHTNKFRVLRYDFVEELGFPTERVYFVEMFEEVEGVGANSANQLRRVDQFVPRDSSGSPFKEILFSFVGITNNDPIPDRAPLLKMANINIAHYRNSADYEDTVYWAGQPTPVITGLTEHWVTKVLKGTVQLGSRASPIMLEAGSTFEFAQIEPNSLPLEAMKEKERQMVALGAKLIEPREGEAITATEENNTNRSETSILGNAVTNVEAAYIRILEWGAMFVGAAVNSSTFELNRDFLTRMLSPQERQAFIADLQAEVISRKEYRDNLRAGGVILDDDDVSQQEIDDRTGLEDDVSLDRERERQEMLSNLDTETEGATNGEPT